MADEQSEIWLISCGRLKSFPGGWYFANGFVSGSCRVLLRVEIQTTGGKQTSSDEEGATATWACSDIVNNVMIRLIDLGISHLTGSNAHIWNSSFSGKLSES